MTEDPKGHLDSMLLAILAERPLHGYGVIEALRRESGGAFDLPSGTIYPALHRLELAGLIEGTWSPAEGRRRRTYSVTKRGHRELDIAREAWRSFASAVGGVLKEPA